jgi:hypothetical protein
VRGRMGEAGRVVKPPHGVRGTSDLFETEVMEE